MKKKEVKKNVKIYLCTECGGDAYMAYSARTKDDWGGKIKKNERLCLTCGRKRLGSMAIF